MKNYIAFVMRAKKYESFKPKTDFFSENSTVCGRKHNSMPEVDE